MGTGVPALSPSRPRRVAGGALLSPVEIKHRMGMGREGVWQQPTAGSGRGMAGGVLGVLLRPPGEGFACSAAPTYQGLHSAAARVGCPNGRWQRGPCGPHAAGGASSSLRPQPCAGKHRVLGPGSRGGGEGVRVTLPCLENMNLHVKVGVGPRPGHRVPQLWRQDHGAVQNGSGEGGMGPGAAGAGRHWARIQVGFGRSGVLGM